MNGQLVRLLLIEDNTAQAQIVQQLLAQIEHVQYQIEWARSLTDAMKMLAEKEFDMVLSDLQLHEGYGLDTLRMVQDQAEDLPIVLVTNLEDETVAIRAIQSGAQDYLMKSRLDIHRIDRALRYAMERHKLVSELRTGYEQRIRELSDQDN